MLKKSLVVLKKFKGLLLGTLIALTGLFFILASFSLPEGITEILLTKKLNTFLPGCEAKLNKSKFYVLKGLTAESIEITKDARPILSLKKLKLKYNAGLLFTNNGNLTLTSDMFCVKQPLTASEFFKFSSNVSGYSFEDELTFEDLILKSSIKGKKIIIDNFKLKNDDLKIRIVGEFEEEQKIDFTVEIFLSKKITQHISEGTKKILFETQKDGFEKIRFKIYGSPKQPSFKIKTQLLELNII